MARLRTALREAWRRLGRVLVHVLPHYAGVVEALRETESGGEGAPRALGKVSRRACIRRRGRAAYRLVPVRSTGGVTSRGAETRVQGRGRRFSMESHMLLHRQGAPEKGGRKRGPPRRPRGDGTGGREDR